MERKKICFIVSTHVTALVFLKEHFKKLSTDFDIYLVAKVNDEVTEKSLKELNIIGFKNIEIERKIDILKDIKALFCLLKYFKEMDFYAVHSVTPKAGLLTALAAKLAGIKHRIHIFTGQVWSVKQGAMRFLLKTLDKLISILDNHILVDGESQRQFLIKNNIVTDKKSKVLGYGSISGVNIDRFNPSIETRNRVRAELGIPKDKIVYGFLGRFKKHKGIDELLTAFSKLTEKRSDAFLLLAGVDEEGYIDRLTDYPLLKQGDNFCLRGFRHNPEEFMQSFDVCCLPSHREGFGLFVIECSCLGIPVICSDVFGLQDTILDDKTGIRHKVRDVNSLFEAMLKLHDDDELRKRLGCGGRKWVLEELTSELITEEWLKFYHNLDNRNV